MEQNASISLEPYSKFEFPWTAQEFDTPRLVARIKRTSSTDSGRLSKYEAPDGTRILWKIFSDNGDAGTLTMHLLRDSWGLFKDLCLKHWVELVMGMPSMPIALFESYNNRLGYSLYSYLCRFPHEIVKYRYVATVRDPVGDIYIADTQQKARLIDRFLYATIDNALCCVEEGKPFSDLHVEVPFITLPLKSLLFQPDKDILRRLSVLEARYKRYRTGAGMAHGRIFPTDTELFTSLMAESAVTVARKMTQDTLQEFWKISYDSIVKADRHLEQLGGRWNTLFHEAEEIAAAGELKASLTALAKVCEVCIYCYLD